MTSKRPRVRIGYQPHLGQVAVHRAFDEGTRFGICVCGRRWGKSRCAHEECRRRMIANPGTIIRWASPVYAQAKARFREALKLFRELGDGWVARTHKGDLRIELSNGSEIAFWSTHDPDNLRGEGVDFLVVDEAGYIGHGVWAEVLRPMLSDTGGGALVIGSPRGRLQWLHAMYERGQSLEGWRSFQFPTWSSPRIPEEEIAAAREELPANVFDQEFGAQFLESAAGVFKNVAACIGGQLEHPKRDHQYAVGVDLARSATGDYSVILVMDVDRRQVVHLERMRGVNFVDQIPRILDAAQRYNDAELIIDQTGVGSPVVDTLQATLGRYRKDEAIDRRGGIRPRSRAGVTGVVLTLQTKTDVIQRLQLDIERRRIRIPEECTELIKELNLYGYEALPSGGIRYSAPEGFHDDTVIALALACFGIPREGSRAAFRAGKYGALIKRLEKEVPRAHRYGLERWYGPTIGWPDSTPMSLVYEMRLLQATRLEGVIAEDEADALARRLYRRMRRNGVDRWQYTDSLDTEEGFGTLAEFVKQQQENDYAP